MILLVFSTALPTGCVSKPRAAEVAQTAAAPSIAGGRSALGDRDVADRPESDHDPRVERSAAARTFWIGGAADKAPFLGYGPHHHVLHVMNAWRDELPGEHHYRGYHELNEIVREVREARMRDSTARVVFIGHSYGGATAMRAARRLEDEGIDVDLLITLDPVWGFPVAPPRRPGRWVNVHQRLDVRDALACVPLLGPPLAGLTCVVTGSTFSDTVATVGRQLGRQAGADVNIEMTQSHGAVSAMLQRALDALPTDADPRSGPTGLDGEQPPR
ncbi:MAG: hypothetical protein FLDDKLPJ_02109 [Phycisphaerae bacterium]|nr:hypothetical protein [Phycisphaerae bacterium]